MILRFSDARFAAATYRVAATPNTGAGFPVQT